MVRAFLLAALLALSFSPLDAREAPKDAQRTEKAAPRERGDLRRDIERISREIYRPAPPARSPKKR